MTQTRRPRPYISLELNAPGIRAPLEWRRVMDTVEALIASEERASRAEHRVRALERALAATLESHDIGHSPCDCVEVRAVLNANRCAMCGGNREMCGHFVGAGAL